MNNSKKTILIMLFPAILTLYFIARILFPAVENYIALREKYQDTKRVYQDTQLKVEELKNNRMLLEEIAELNNQVADFDIQMPPGFQDEFFLVDLGKFSISTATKVTALDSKKEKEFEIKNPNEEKQKRKSRRVKTEEKPVYPLTIYEKPFQIKTEGHYNQVICFVNKLESYQRKFIINGISAQISKSDEKNPNPKIELTIDGSTFKAVRTLSSSEDETITVTQ